MSQEKCYLHVHYKNTLHSRLLCTLSWSTWRSELLNFSSMASGKSELSLFHLQRKTDLHSVNNYINSSSLQTKITWKWWHLNEDVHQSPTEIFSWFCWKLWPGKHLKEHHLIVSFWSKLQNTMKLMIFYHATGPWVGCKRSELVCDWRLFELTLVRMGHRHIV